MTWSDLRLLFPLVRREFQLGTRGPVFWVVASAGGLYGLWRALGSGGSLALACYQEVQFAVFGLGAAGVFLGGAAAARDLREGARELVLAKHLGNRPLLAMGRCLGAWLSLLAVVLVMLLCVLVGELLSGGEAWGLAVYGNALARVLLPLALATALGFTLTTLFTTPLAAGLAAIYWVAVPLAAAHVPAILDVTVVQHWPMVMLLTLALVALSGWRYGRAIPGIPRRAAGVIAAALWVAAGLSLLPLLARGEDAITGVSPVLLRMSAQPSVMGARAPGFWLTSADGHLVGLDDFAGRPVLLVFWSPADAATASTFAMLRRLAVRYRTQRLACLAVGTDHDAAAFAPFVRNAGPEVTVLADRGRHFVPGKTAQDSALMAAYSVDRTPSAFFIGPDRVLVEGLSESEPEALARVAARHLEH